MPGMSTLSLAYHYPGGEALDPLNVRRSTCDSQHSMKVEGSVGFWEPTPGAVRAIMKRIGYGICEVLGYDEDLVDEAEILTRFSSKMGGKVLSGLSLVSLPTTRVHMVFGKSELIIPQDRRVLTLPDWDFALLEAMGQR